ncbi:MAG: SDR family NAD(P)-dependent oxidoreductase [Chitinivorax sp.]
MAAGILSMPYRSAYAAAKHAIIGFYDALRAEVFAAGIGVSVILPGYVRSNVSLSALTGDGSTHVSVSACCSAVCRLLCWHG